MLAVQLLVDHLTVDLAARKHMVLNYMRLILGLLCHPIHYSCHSEALHTDKIEDSSEKVDLVRCVALTEARPVVRLLATGAHATLRITDAQASGSQAWIGKHHLWQQLQLNRQAMT
ncbi:unnamed protein product [Protopolystoma xenopodis]|uniref:Uncharacterized protein n=1 Tax=Protopolystoma xenopodis TaxID=117903 RepID=A0A3S5FGU0_9PLAT|nr:unnamed protein product [Protopolystoma xenopodis]